MRKIIRDLILVLSFMLVTVACGCSQQAAFNSKDVTEELNKLNIKYTVDNTAEKHMLAVAPTIINIEVDKNKNKDEDRIFVYEYKSSKAMERDAATIDEGGCTIGRYKVSWIAAPHFYKKGRLIVQYVGGNKDILSALEKILGKQFAGYSGY